MANPARTERPVAQTNAIPNERRKSPRYAPLQDSLWLGWWADEEFVLVDARLVNISNGGVQAEMKQAPLKGQVVWMRLEGTTTQSSLAANVLESRWVTLRRRYVVRLEFQQACTADHYASTVFGH